MNDKPIKAKGCCSCGNIQYQLESTPLFIHCCHCTRCQRETGSAFAINAMIEADRVTLLEGEVESVEIPTLSGGGQVISRCPECRIAVWSYYSGADDKVLFIRAGTLENPHLVEPDIHIFTDSKLPWTVLPAHKPAVAEYYRRSEYWPAESVERYKAAIGR